MNLQGFGLLYEARSETALWVRMKDPEVATQLTSCQTQG